MLYVFYGSDEKEAREAASKFAEDFILKKPGANIFRLNSLSWDRVRFEELLASRGLFSANFVVILSGLSENEEAFDFILERLPGMKESPNIFILREAEVSKEKLKLFEKYAEKMEEFVERGLGVGSKKEGFNVFILTDALGARDRKKLWVLLQKAYFEGLVAEEIFWRLQWMVKVMLLSSQTGNANKAELKPFVFGKGRSFAKNFSQKELLGLSEKFVRLYHDSRRGLVEFDLGLERIVLSL